MRIKSHHDGWFTRWAECADHLGRRRRVLRLDLTLSREACGWDAEGGVLVVCLGSSPVFVRKEDALRALEDAVSDKPSWARTLLVVPIELDERDIPPN